MAAKPPEGLLPIHGEVAAKPPEGPPHSWGGGGEAAGGAYLIYVPLTVCDVGPRDGLQNEAKTLDPAVRAELCDRLAAAGLKRMEAASFVNPKLVPQMAGAEEVMAALHRKPGTVYAGLVLNEKGYDRALAAGVDEIHYAFSAADEFGRRNQNATTAEGLKTALALVARARSDRMPITVTVSVAFMDADRDRHLQPPRRRLDRLQVAGLEVDRVLDQPAVNLRGQLVIHRHRRPGLPAPRPWS